MSSSRKDEGALVKRRLDPADAATPFVLRAFTHPPDPTSRPTARFRADQHGGSGSGATWTPNTYTDAQGRISYQDGRRVDLALHQAAAEHQAERQADYQRGYARGAQDGFQQAAAEAEARIAQAVEAVRGVAENLQSFEARLCRHLEAHLVDIVRSMAMKLVRRELDSDPGVVLSMARAALTAVHGAFEMELLVSAADHRLISERQADLLAGCENIRQVQIIVDDALRSGDCRVRTTSGDVDARLEVQLEELLAQMNQEVGFEPRPAPHTDDARTLAGDGTAGDPQEGERNGPGG
ncbi:MAG: hypothetical protein HYY96_06060 [Candidatus Tectomicrobia bacterium]|nr:hypothetical protein [Candidatus Tectomicrobia bacterium]